MLNLRLRRGSLLAWSCLWTLVAVTHAQSPPVAKRVSPIGVQPGQPTRLTITGAELSGMRRLLTSLAVDGALAGDVENNGELKDRVIFDLAVPTETTVGLQALRVLGANGISEQKLWLVDDLPTVPQGGENQSQATAQPVPFPAGVDGVLGNLERRFFRFEAAAGQRVSIEVVARRLGSALDPLIVLYRDDGRELVSADDVPGLGGDCQLVHRCEAAGGYVIELRDIRYRGGDDFPFRLRIGDFPCVQTAYPPAVQRGTTAMVEFAGIDPAGCEPFAATIPADWPHDWFPVAARRTGGQGSGFATVAVTDRAEFVEQEPNDAADAANPVTADMNLNGRLHVAGDVDRFKLTVDAGTRLIFSGVTRQEGAPTDLLLRALDAAGKPIATADDDGVGEGRLDHTFAAAGEYVVEVSDLLRRGGSQYPYRVQVTRFAPGFALAVQGDACNVPPGGTAVLEVQAARSGYNEAIDLAVEGLPEGVQVSPARIGPGQTQGFVALTLPREGAALDATAIHVVGTATINGEARREVASSATWLRGRWNNLAVVPPPARRAVTAAAAAPARLSLSIEPVEVVFGRDLQGTVTVRVQRGEGLAGDVTLATLPEKDALPKEITLEVKPIPKDADHVVLQFSATGKAPLGPFSIVLMGTLKQDQTTATATTPTINYRLDAPLTLALDPPAGALKVGGTLPLKLKVQRNPAFTGAIKITAAGLPAGVTLPEVVIAADAAEADLMLSAVAETAVGKLAGAKLTATAVDAASLTAELALPELVIE